MAAFLGWRIRQDLQLGRASGRGMSFSKDKQPVLFRLVMTFNCIAFVCLVLSAIFESVSLLGNISQP
jgi:hypothetical protein